MGQNKRTVAIEDVLHCLQLIANYLPWPAVKPPIGYTRPMKMALGLLGVRDGRDEDGRASWKIVRRWRSYLRAAGIDPLTFTVIDWGRFDLAWQQLTTAKNPRCYSDRIQRVRIAQGATAPLAHDYTYWVENKLPDKATEEPRENEFAKQIKSILWQRAG